VSGHPLGSDKVIRLSRFAGLILLAVACAAREPRSDYIGSATMLVDRTIVLDLRAEGPDGMIGDSREEYPPSHPDYRMVLEHIGPLAPGESVLVKPFPDH
jgi:hypothetical protein